MNISSLIYDGFLDSFYMLRQYANKAEFKDITNPEDGVVYPGICTDIPINVELEINHKLSKVLGRKVHTNYTFMRLSLKDAKCPHQAHNDSSMGKYSLMLYLNDLEDCVGGTSLIRHIITGLDKQPVDEEQYNSWEKDMNTPSMWKPYIMCEMLPNRAFIFDAALMHRAEPVGGFGDNKENGRLVLTTFFS